MVDAVGTTTYAYNNGGQLWTENGPWDSDTVTNTYVNGLRTALALQQPTGAWTNGFAYDYAGRLTNVTSQAGSHGYQLGGTASGSPLARVIRFPNGAGIVNDYDPVGRVWSTAMTNSSGTLNRHEYSYNTAGQREQQVRTDASYVDYRYDPIGQLTYAHSSVATEDRDYVYDTAWNLNWRTNSGLAQRFNVDNKNQLTNAVGVKISYDLNGNVSDDRTLWYSWDDENQLVQVLDGFYLTFRTDFVYDGKGRLRKRMEYVKDPGPEPGPGRDGMEPDAIVHWVLVSETRYIYDGNRVIQERTSNNVPTVSYTRGTDLSGSLEGAGGIGGLLSRSHGYSSGNWTQHNYYHADGNGNITYLASATTNSCAASYRYDPFGNLISKSGPLADANVYRFSSKELHVNSGLYYYLYRFYSPNWQRWMNRDPVQEQPGLAGRRKFNLQVAAGWYLYGFCFNAPNTLVDSNGKSASSHTVSEAARWIGLGGRCCNRSNQSEWYLDNGNWHLLPAGNCTDLTTDCDGMTCGGQFHSVSTFGNIACEGGKCKTLVPTGTFTPPRYEDLGPGWTPGDGLHTSPGDRSAQDLPPYVWPM